MLSRRGNVVGGYVRTQPSLKMAGGLRGFGMLFRREKASEVMLTKCAALL